MTRPGEQPGQPIELRAADKESFSVERNNHVAYRYGHAQIHVAVHPSRIKIFYGSDDPVIAPHGFQYLSAYTINAENPVVHAGPFTLTYKGKERKRGFAGMIGGKNESFEIEVHTETVLPQKNPGPRHPTTQLRTWTREEMRRHLGAQAVAERLQGTDNGAANVFVHDGLPADESMTLRPPKVVVTPPPQIAASETLPDTPINSLDSGTTLPDVPLRDLVADLMLEGTDLNEAPTLRPAPASHAHPKKGEK